MTGFLLLVVGTSPAAPATTYYQFRNLPTTATINAVAFDAPVDRPESARPGVAVGDSGVIFTTADGGETWLKRTLDTRARLLAAEYLAQPCGEGTSECVWIAGVGGTLLFSPDGGATWCGQDSGTKETIHGLSFGDDLVAVGTNGVILQAEAPGCGADAQYHSIPSGTSLTLYDITRPGRDGSRYIAGAAGTILTLAGTTAAKVATPTSADLYGIGIGSRTYGTAEAQASGCTFFERVGAVGAEGTIVQGGYSECSGGPTRGPFEVGDSGTTATLHDVDFKSGTSFDVSGEAVGDFGTVLTSSGGSWAIGAPGTCLSLYAVASLERLNGDPDFFAAGERGIGLADRRGQDQQPLQPDCATSPTRINGYRMVAADGGLFSFGARRYHGSAGGTALQAPVVGGATDPTGYEGYWMVASDGGVFAFGSGFYGSAVGKLDAPAVEIEPTPRADGYWVVTAKGKVIPFGAAASFGDVSTMALNQPIIGMSVTSTGSGYWLLGQDGGIFAFGDAQFFGSAAQTQLNAPIIDLVPAVDNDGYYLLGRDGGVFTFGSARFAGSTGSLPLNAQIIAMLVAPGEAGYWLAAADGGVFSFGSVPFLGSMGAAKLNAPVVDLIN
jgi:photosystem II stability/assembly factor-like uncharacterized protein